MLDTDDLSDDVARLVHRDRYSILLFQLHDFNTVDGIILCVPSSRLPDVCLIYIKLKLTPRCVEFRCTLSLCELNGISFLIFLSRTNRSCLLYSA